MTHDRSLTSQEIDDGWCLEEAPPRPSAEDAPYEEYLLIDERLPSSGFEQAFWEQREKRTLKHRFGEGALGFVFGTHRTS